MLSLALLNLEHCEPGTEVTVRWGEPSPADDSGEQLHS